MALWIRDLSLKYKFWALNLVSFATTLLLVLFALQLEQQSRSQDAQNNAQQIGALIQSWPEGTAMPTGGDIQVFPAGQAITIEGRPLAARQGWVAIEHDRLFDTTPVLGAQLVTRPGNKE